MNGARGRTRTGTVLPPRDFRTRYGFRRRAGGAFGVWTLPLPWRREGGQEPSSLYIFPDVTAAGLARGATVMISLRFPGI